MPTSLRSALETGMVVLDGGLGTLVEHNGHDLSNQLWSARLLIENPEAIRRAHAEFFAAGASVGISASYQVSFEALTTLGIDTAGTRSLLALSVQLAREAAAETDGDAPRWVAASVGPYGAMLADGSEYHGAYGLSARELRDWHAPRLRALAAAEPDILAIETIPCLAEIDGLVAELDGTGHDAWLSVTVAGDTLRSGESLADAFALAASIDEVIAVGVNCCAPSDVTGAIETARRVTTKPIVVYPNSGELWDAKNRRWMGDSGFSSSLIAEWVGAGAHLVGGCCRVRPDQIRAIARGLNTTP